jgi:hypothetical protein
MKKYDWSTEINGNGKDIVTMCFMCFIIIMGIVSMIN